MPAPPHSQLQQPWQYQRQSQTRSGARAADEDDIGLSYYQQGQYTSPQTQSSRFPHQMPQWDPRQQLTPTDPYGRQHPYRPSAASQQPQQQYYEPNYGHNEELSPPTETVPLPTSSSPHHPPDGFHPDKPLQWENLTDEERRIAKTFPADLDEEGSTMWQSVKQMVTDWRKWLQWRYWYYYIALIICAALLALLTIYHHQIIHWLTPISQQVNTVKWGWIIPVAILFVISFPPLFGHEIVAILCGIVYPLWIAFGIVALGTLLGELGNFWAFKWCFRRLAEKYERKSLNYGCMAHIVREGGFMVILIARLSAIPGHFTTAVFATVGMNIFIFTLAALLSMPKQLAVVYLGVAIGQSGTGEETTKSKIIKYVVLIISGIITLAAAWYLYRKMEQARPTVQARLKAKRYAMLCEARQKADGSAVRGHQYNHSDEPEASVWSHGQHKDELSPEEEVGYHQFDASAAAYPPAQHQQQHQHHHQRTPSHSSWAQRLGLRNRDAEQRGPPGHRRPSRHGSQSWARGGTRVEDEEAQTAMLSVAAPLAAGTVGRGGYDYSHSTESLHEQHPPQHSQRYDEPQYGRSQASQPLPPPRQHEPTATSPATSPVEPLDMDVLLAATTRNRTQPSARTQDQPMPRIASPPSMTAYEQQQAAQRQRSQQNGRSGPRQTSDMPPTSYHQSAARYRKATEGEYSLYSLGASNGVETEDRRGGSNSYGQQRSQHASQAAAPNSSSALAVDPNFRGDASLAPADVASISSGQSIYGMGANAAATASSSRPPPPSYTSLQF